MLSFKPRVGKVKMGQTTSGFTVISPFYLFIWGGLLCSQHMKGIEPVSMLFDILNLIVLSMVQFPVVASNKNGGRREG